MIKLQERHQRLSRLASIDEVFARVEALAKPVEPREVDVSAALGRVLANDAAVISPHPPAAISLRDGWAVRSELIADAGPYTPMAVLPAPEWVEVGTVLPHDTDAVLASDAVVLTGGTAEVLATATPNEGLLAAGTDARPGDPLRRAGECIRAVDVAVLRAAGIFRVSIREPRVLIASANESIAEIDDTVAPLIACTIDAEGCAAQVRRTKLEGRSAVESVLVDDTADAIVTIGGTGVGRHDNSVSTLSRLGRVDIHGMGLSPGDTAALGSAAGRPVLLLPGRLDAALAIFLVVGRRLLARLTGRTAMNPGTRDTLRRKIVSRLGLAELVLVRRCQGGVEPIASQVFPLEALARADGWVLVPAEEEGYPPGSTVEMHAFP